jgi:hypothetical protein
MLKRLWLLSKRYFTGYKPGDIVWYKPPHGMKETKRLIFCFWEKTDGGRIYKTIRWSRISTDKPYPDELEYHYSSELRFCEVANREVLLTSTIEDVRRIGLRMIDDSL